MDESFEELIAIVELLKDVEFTQFRYHSGDLLIEISRGGPLASPPTSPTPAAPLVGVGEHHSASGEEASSSVSANATPVSAAGTTSAHEDHGDAVVVEAPMLGTFYRSPKPGEPPFVQVGDIVEPTTVVGIVEVMKLMNSVTAGVAGTVIAIDASDGELVEPGSPLVRVRPAE